jgi:hypothetical protein
VSQLQYRGWQTAFSFLKGKVQLSATPAKPVCSLTLSRHDVALMTVWLNDDYSDQTLRSPAGILGRRAAMVHPCWCGALPTM